MGLAILTIYIPTLLVTLIVSIFIGSLIIKKTHSEETIGKNKKLHILFEYQQAIY